MSLRSTALKIFHSEAFQRRFGRFFAQHPNANPNCFGCEGSGYVKGEHCHDCINVDVPEYGELGVGDA